MGNLYDDLLSLQTIPTAYTDWAEYRERLTGFILEHTDPHATACIVGAGACNDFDLSSLTSHFDRLLLLDRNVDAMREIVPLLTTCCLQYANSSAGSRQMPKPSRDCFSGRWTWRI